MKYFFAKAQGIESRKTGVAMKFFEPDFGNIIALK